MPDITHAAVVRHGVLRLTFADGLMGEVEVLGRTRGPVFDEASTPEGLREGRGRSGDGHGDLAGWR